MAHGIDVITAADYFSLGNRQQAYLDISKTVAAFERWGYLGLAWRAAEKSVAVDDCGCCVYGFLQNGGERRCFGAACFRGFRD